MADIQNVTLAGGVTVGASVDMMISPAAAYALGIAGATACMVGYKYLSPFLARHCRIQDQCGIHNLHGLTGLISCAAGICAILWASEEVYGPSLYEIFSHRAPLEDDPQFLKLHKLVPSLVPGLGRTAQEQALFQAAAVALAIGVSLFGGIFTGFVLKLPGLAAPPYEQCFDDELFFDVPYNYNAPLNHTTITTEDSVV
ncbi:hypothetical protein WMY93_028018 [Mugilogobius chulae]|uniref:Ammonium transporter AmtB-like domain-containing protein n=1 Tax=Mugilogobius chulae TaxID=88201 RepID=A0AAW0MYW2_9GOBI